MPFDFDAAVSAPFRMQPGLRRLAPGTPQLTPLGPESRHLREKLAVFGAFWPQALVARDGFDPAPALHAVLAQAAAEHPGAWAWDGQCAQALRLGAAVDTQGRITLDAPDAPAQASPAAEVAHCLRGLPPAWRLPALLGLAFAEDLAIVDAADTRIPWLAVALPSHWAPPDKVGRPFAEVHAPVADNALIVRAADALVKLVTGPERWERFVWNVTSHPRLHAHPARVDPQRWAPETVAALPAGAWWRTERQTFIPLPEHRQAVFTIEVDTCPLAEAIDTQVRAAKLHDAIASMSPAVLAYRSLAPVREALLAWLASLR